MIKLRCHNKECKELFEVDEKALLKDIYCPKCGALQDIPESTKDLGKEPDENWLDCLEPEGFEWSYPAGVIRPVVGEPLYTPAVGGKPLTREQFMSRYKVDPELYIKARDARTAAKARDDDYDLGGPRKERR